MKKYLLLTSLVFVLFISNSAFAIESSLTISWQVLDAILRPGGETTVFLTLTNPSIVPVRTVELFISPGPYIIPSTYHLEVGNLEAGTSQQTSLTVKISSTAVSTTSYLKIKATYYGDSVKRETTINIPITIRRVPILQIEDVDYNFTIIEPGSTVQLNFNLKNNGDGSAKDVRVVVNQVEKVFVTKMNEAFLDEIKPNQKTPLSFTLTIDPSVAVGTYSIPISLYYLDEMKKENYSFVKYIGLPISGKYNFIVMLESQDKVAPGQEGSLKIKVVNGGTQEAQFLTLKLLPSEPFSQITPSSAYIGNLKSDDYDTEKFNFAVNGKAKPGIYPLNLKISWKDMYGKNYTKQYYVDVRVFSPKELSGWRTPLLLVGVGLFITFVTLLTKKFLKRKR